MITYRKRLSDEKRSEIQDIIRDLRRASEPLLARLFFPMIPPREVIADRLSDVVACCGKAEDAAYRAEEKLEYIRDVFAIRQTTPSEGGVLPARLFVHSRKGAVIGWLPHPFVNVASNYLCVTTICSPDYGPPPRPVLCLICGEVRASKCHTDGDSRVA